MRHQLALHPQSRAEAIEKVEIEAALIGSSLTLRYIATGATPALKVATLSAPNRVDGLWRTTCFEAFVAAEGTDAYYEFNFSPSTEWAAYRFSAYREGMTPAAETGEPDIQTRLNARRLDLQAQIRLGSLTALPRDADFRLAVAAVIEEASGALSYWALAHPPGRADFHHPDGFIFHLTREK